MSDLKMFKTESGQVVVDYEYAKQVVEQQQTRISEIEAQLRESTKANRLSQLIGERNIFRRVSAMNVDGWLKQKMKSEIERVTCRIEEIKKEQDHE